MRTPKWYLLLGAVLLQINAMGQNGRIVPIPAPRTLEEGLRSHGISDLSEASLTAALKNVEPQIRILAASKLAEDHDAGALPAIEEALSRETNIDAQIGLAEALWALNDRNGIAHLQAMCGDTSISLPSMMAVVRALLIIRSSGSGCAETFLALMNSARDPGELGMAASLLPFIYTDSNRDQAQRIVDKLRTLLLDRRQQAIARIMCAGALAKIATPESVEAIRQAISREEDPNTKSAFESDLKTSEKNRKD
jgi:HEAT repeat protein